MPRAVSFQGPWHTPSLGVFGSFSILFLPPPQGEQLEFPFLRPELAMTTAQTCLSLQIGTRQEPSGVAIEAIRMSYFGEYFWVSKIRCYFGGGSWKGCGGFYGDGGTWGLVGRVLGRWRVCRG